jgi:hypothetical protein
VCTACRAGHYNFCRQAFDTSLGIGSRIEAVEVLDANDLCVGQRSAQLELPPEHGHPT